MDEPTAVLAPQEIEGLFDCMRSLKSEGRSLIIITHKLDEVMAIADTVTVMRRGQSVHNCATVDTDPTLLAEMMLGEPIIPTTVTREQGRADNANGSTGRRYALRQSRSRKKA